jgi:hypothetical protein
LGFGIFDGKNVYNYRGITAEITDSGNLKWFVPLKHILGDYFVCKINNQTYVFRIMYDRIKTSKRKGAMSFQTLDYNTEHYMPVSGDTKEIELLLNETPFKKINGKIQDVLRLFGRSENPSPFEIPGKGKPEMKHDLEELVEILSSKQKKYPNEVEATINYFKSLSVKQIVTPLGRISQFIEDDLKATDANAIGQVWDEAVEIDKDHKTVTNVPVNLKKSYLVMILIFLVVGAVIGLIYFAYEAGRFDNIGIDLGMNGGGADYSKESLMKRYPSGASLRAAVDSGQLDYNKLPKDVKSMVDKTPSPSIVASP